MARLGCTVHRAVENGQVLQYLQQVDGRYIQVQEVLPALKEHLCRAIDRISPDSNLFDDQPRLRSFGSLQTKVVHKSTDVDCVLCLSTKDDLPFADRAKGQQLLQQLAEFFADGVELPTLGG